MWKEWVMSMRLVVCEMQRVAPVSGLLHVNLRASTKVVWPQW